MTALVVEGLVGGYGPDDQVVKGVGLTVAPGRLVCVIGPNGAGKSTVLKLLAGLLRPMAGSIRVFGQAVTPASPRAMIAAGCVLVPQERNVFGALTVEENLLMGAYTERGRAKSRIAEAYARFPLLRERRRQAARTLSGGQRQVLAMGQALMAAPRLLMLDEPTAGLSPVAAQELFATIRALADSGMPILMVEQNALDALHVSDEAVVLVDGRNAHGGPARALAADPTIRRLFLGGRAVPDTTKEMSA
ncbi:amino acid/amide ABC transporter ATP-binding protein 2 (HAAT family) [Humitalea rosea]|uniref:Amino acid/amide ABC transporter ATP-binding protein 2 (HAAT family) n=1 Tax=Humitalea rosea TaxID=990373 RepID=A0A2W7IB99_9PROT|nr:ABC transporter ATP-binding protein [Humitalea rosea]PZW43639.1 amino acid/amide ABC transporter ATP-binding protein 2 (HAAT family) [Humitalea rosea]